LIRRERFLHVHRNRNHFRRCKNPQLASEGKRRIEWAQQSMPVLQLIRQRFLKENPWPGCASPPACTSPPKPPT